MEDNKIIQFIRKFELKSKSLVSPKRGYSLFSEGMSFYRQEKDLMALKCFLQAEKEGYESSDMFSYIAQIYYAQKEDNEKMKYYIDKAIKIDPEYGYPYHLLAIWYDKFENDYENALKYNLLAEKYKHDTDPQMMRHISWLYSHIASGNQLKALEYATKAINLEPENAYNWYYKGWVYYLYRDFENAIKFYKKAEDLGALEPEFYYEYSYSYSELGEHEKAVEYANKCIFMDKENYSGYYRKGYAYSYWGNSDKALQSFLIAEKKGCDRADMYGRISLFYVDRKDSKKAHEYADKAFNLNKQEVEANLAKAVVAFDLDYDYKTSVKYLKRVIKYSKLSGADLGVEVYGNLVSGYYNLGKYKLALQSVDEVLEIFPNELGLLLLKALALQNVRKYDEAEELLKDYIPNIEKESWIFPMWVLYEYNKKKPKDYDKVLEMLEKTTTRDGECRKALQGFCFYEKKNYEKCLQLMYEYAQEVEEKEFHSLRRGEFKKYFRRLVKIYGQNEERLKFIAKKFSLDMIKKSSD